MILNNLKNKYFENAYSKLLNKLIKKEFNNYKYFIDTSKIDGWGAEYNSYFNNNKKIINSITATNESDRYEIETYEYYAGYVGEKMNRILRQEQFILFPEVFEPRIKVLTNSLNKFKLSDNVIVIRRIPNIKFYQKVKKGEIIQEKGFLSTSLNLFSRLDYQSEYSPIENEVLMILKIPKGTNACYIEQISKRKEYELLIQRNQKIKIIMNRKILNNRIVLGELYFKKKG